MGLSQEPGSDSPLDKCAGALAEQRHWCRLSDPRGVITNGGPTLRRAPRDSREDSPSLVFCPATRAARHRRGRDSASLTWLLPRKLACHQDHGDGTISPGVSILAGQNQHAPSTCNPGKESQLAPSLSAPSPGLTTLPLVPATVSLCLQSPSSDTRSSDPHFPDSSILHQK